MIKTLTILLLFISSFSVNAQSTELLNGKWLFKRALNTEVDTEGQKVLNSQVINKMTFEFKSNREFIGFVIGRNTKGKWSLSKESKIVILDTLDGKIEFAILKLTETELILKLGLGEFLMKKI